jgi:hypothetical protein
MPLVGFEPTIPVFERAKTVHTLDCAATVIGFPLNSISKFVFVMETQRVFCGVGTEFLNII